MTDTIASLWGQLEAWLFTLVSSAWAYPTLFVSTAADGVFPPIPGESVLIVLAVGARTIPDVSLLVVLVVAALGAWCGDQISFAIGSAVGTRRVPFLRGTRGRSAVSLATRTLDRRGASFIVAARFVPVGRMAVNVSAGAVGFSRRRFMALSGAASVTWALYVTLIGVVASRWLGDRPLLAVGVGVVAGILLGVVIDRVLSRRGLRRTRDGGRHRAGDVPQAVFGGCSSPAAGSAALAAVESA